VGAALNALAQALRAPFVRALLLGALVLLLQVPACMVGELARGREQSRDAAVAELARTWGGGQDVLGPFLVVPYRVDGRDDKGAVVTREVGHVVLLPERLELRARAAVEARRRGLFEVPVYRVRVEVSGRFRDALEHASRLVPAAALQWAGAHLALELGDVHAIEAAGSLRWNGAAVALAPGAGWLGARGVHAPLAGRSPAAPAGFALELELRGSRALHFAPLGRETVAAVEADWPHPSFGGAFLPATRTVTAGGFAASWRVTHLARGLPDAWKGGEAPAEALAGSRFGVELLQPVDPYRMSERSLKYGVLFTGLTFLVIWLAESVTRQRVGLLRYLLVGSALCLFYLLELSLAEHLGFAAAYALAAALVTVQVALYARAAVPGKRSAAALGAGVGALYGLLYVLLREEEHALLVGSAFLFVVLSAVMFLTRRLPQDDSGQPAAGP
jgi:inner membrane protein